MKTLPIVESGQGENEGILNAAKMMLIAARTAPKSGGRDDVQTLLVYGEEKDAIAQEMDRIGKERGLPSFARDAQNVRDSAAVVLIGVDGSKSFGLDCGACGHATCTSFNQAERKKGLDFAGPTCLYKSLDAGIALGSAAKIAADLNVDNRIMYRIGTAAMRLKMMEKSTAVMGIPVSAKGKSIYFDRK